MFPLPGAFAVHRIFWLLKSYTPIKSQLLPTLNYSVYHYSSMNSHMCVFTIIHLTSDKLQRLMKFSKVIKKLQENFTFLPDKYNNPLIIVLKVVFDLPLFS